ncbi:MAG: bifunctional 2',3'-cyclic-nucleotide 2'-phosphodiesterase/3'-nucleotidase, partial [Pseudorhodobacter sp.]
MLIKPHPFSSSVTEGQAHLRILQTTDLHACIFPYDYYSDRPTDSLGLARTAALIADARAGAANSILVDNGDLLQGSALGDYIAYDRGLKDGDLHPVIAAMNTLQYDVATLGNHEFNYGLAFLLAALGRSKFPFVSATALVRKGVDPRKDKRLLPPYVMLDRELSDGNGKLYPIRIGVLGLLPPQFVTWDESLLKGAVQSRDMVETARALIPEMKEAGADLIVVLAHTGIGEERHHDGMENAARPLARLDGIDALVTGHTHMVFPSKPFEGLPGVDINRGTLHGTPTSMAGFWGSHLGVIDLRLARDAGTWTVIDSQSRVLPIAETTASGKRRALVRSRPQVLKAAQRQHEATLEYMRSPIGSTLQPLHSYFALIMDCPSVQIICRAQQRFVAQQLEGTKHAGLPLLSAAAPFKVGGRAGPENYTDIPIGPVYQRSVADLYGFPNTICALRMCGRGVAEWLERSASAFRQLTLGQKDQVLHDEGFPPYHFDVILGLTYEIDPTQPARYSVEGEMQDPDARRIKNLRYLGSPIDPEADF